MGLDMFLYSTVRVESIEELETIRERVNGHKSIENLNNELDSIKKEKDIIWDIPIKLSNWNGLEVNISHQECYWRKFNALHGWFVEECQGGVDECQESIVPLEKIRELYLSIEHLEKGKPLPDNFKPVSGFFFGGTEKDDWFWSDVAQLKHELMYLIHQVDHRERTLIYKSSW